MLSVGGLRELEAAPAPHDPASARDDIIPSRSNTSLSGSRGDVDVRTGSVRVETSGEARVVYRPPRSFVGNASFFFRLRSCAAPYATTPARRISLPLFTRRSCSLLRRNASRGALGWI